MAKAKRVFARFIKDDSNYNVSTIEKDVLKKGMPMYLKEYNGDVTIYRVHFLDNKTQQQSKYTVTIFEKMLDKQGNLNSFFDYGKISTTVD